MTTPTFALDFTGAVLDPRVSLTRAANTATVVDQSGAIVLVNANTPRFDYANGVCRGLLIEESRTNLLLNSVWSGAIDGTPGTAPTSWSIGFAGGSVVSVASGKYAAGNAVRLSATAARQFLQQSISVAANTTYTVTVSALLHSGTMDMINLIDAANSPAGSTKSWELNGVVVSSATNIPAGNNTLTLKLAVAATAGTTTIRIGIGCATSRTGNVTFDIPQAEDGAFATSYIPTTTTALLRNADVAAVTGSNFSDFWQASKGGTQVVAIPSTISGTRPLVQFDDGTANEIIALQGNAADPELYIVDGGTPQVQLDAGTITANASHTLTGWWDTNDCRARYDSGATVIDQTATIPTVTQMRIGSDGTNYLNGHIATIGYYDRFSGQVYSRRKNKAVFRLL